MTHQELKSMVIVSLEENGEMITEKFQEMVVDKVVDEMLNNDYCKYAHTHRTIPFNDSELLPLTLELYWFELDSYKLQA